MSDSATVRRVLLVEDDLSLQRFVTMALEDSPVDLVAVLDVDAAMAQLRARPFDLVLTDLMLPGRHGTELLAELQADPALRGPARVAVFSAGLNAQVRQQLLALDAWRFLSKPCSLAELQACIDELPADADTDANTGASPAPSATPDRAQPAAPLDPAAEAAAIEQHFGGHAALYHAFRASCLAQFPLDLEAGRRACEQGDAQRLRHLAHSLKSVLLTLGHPAAAELARQLERDAETPAAGPELRALWTALAAQISHLRCFRAIAAQIRQDQQVHLFTFSLTHLCYRTHFVMPFTSHLSL